MVRGDDQAAIGLRVLAPDPVEPEPDQEERQQQGSGERVEEEVDALVARVLVVGADPLLTDAIGGAGLRRLPRLLPADLGGRGLGH